MQTVLKRLLRSGAFCVDQTDRNSNQTREGFRDLYDLEPLIQQALLCPDLGIPSLTRLLFVY